MSIPPFIDFVFESADKLTLYHGVRDPAVARTIVKDGFDLDKIRPQWNNDLAVSTLTTERAVIEYFGTDRGLTVLRLDFRGRVVDHSALGYVPANDAREYTDEIVSRGIDAVRLGGSGARQVFVYNLSCIRSVTVASVHPTR